MNEREECESWRLAIIFVVDQRGGRGWIAPPAAPAIRGRHTLTAFHYLCLPGNVVVRSGNCWVDVSPGR